MLHPIMCKYNFFKYTFLKLVVPVHPSQPKVELMVWT